MRKIILATLIALLNFTTCAAADEDELNAAEIRLTCAVCSLGAYSGDESFLFRSMLTSRGWNIEKLSKKHSRADVKAFLVSKDNVKILIVAGTESLKDFEVDFRAGRVPLNADMPIDDSVKRPGDTIFVHRGFRDYADVVLSDGLFERLKTSLNANPNEKLYLTGHSLGGSVAIVMGLRFIDSGVDKNRFAVVTFGSPAVGSKALAKSYEDKLDLTRVVMKGDEISRTTRTLGFADFGEMIKCDTVDGEQSEHSMAGYLDSMIRDYYDAGGSFSYEAPNKVNATIYVAPVQIEKDHFRRADAKLIVNAINDSLTNHFGQLTFAKPASVNIDEKQVFESDFDEYINAASKAGCKYTLIRILRAKKIRDARSGERLVTLEGIIFDENGFPLSMQTSGTSTENLTLLEAALSAQENLAVAAKNVFTK